MWNNIFKVTPTDGQVVWVRVQWFFGVPVICTYDATLQQFTSNDDGVIFPAYIIGRWKVYTGSTGLPIGSGIVATSFIVG